MNAREVRQAELEGEIENATLALKNQLTEYKEKGSNVLLVLGIVFSAYLLYKLLTQSDEAGKKYETKLKEESFLKNALIGLVSSVAIGFAKDQILGIIDRMMDGRNN